MGSFATPLSGLTTSQDQLQNVSNNLANLDTDGFKDETVSFYDIFSAAGATNGSGDPLQTGSGVTVAATVSDFSEGNLTATNIASNMALSGTGFFITQNANGGHDYTRDGSFTTSNTGDLVTSGGELVLGYPANNGVVNTSAALQPLQVGTGVTIPAVPSTTFSISANLDANDAIGTTASSSLPVFDSLGNSHTLSVTYTKTAANTWSYNVTIPSADLNPAPSGTTTTVATGTLNFNSSGVLISTQPTGAPTTSLPSAGIAVTIPAVVTPPAVQPTFADGAATMNLNWSLVTSGNTVISQTASPDATSATSTNGFASGTLQGYSVAPNGTIDGVFSSGQTLALGQVALASFSNQQGLIDIGNNNYQPSAASGPPVVGLPGTGGRATIVGGSVEQSNVNIATEFAKLIIAQQAYSANAKSITTFNQVSQTTIAILQ
jgi:flagellar hook protein FlgE